MCIQIDLVDIDLLRPHEETDQEYVKILTEKISRDKILRRPLLIDSEEMIILDGHHRYEALKRLGMRKVPVIKIRYKDDEHIKIDKWIRIYMIKNTLDLSYIKDLLRKSFEKNIFSTEVFNDNTILVKNVSTEDPVSFYMSIHLIENELKDHMIRFEFRKSMPRLNRLYKENNKILIIDPPKLNKDHVIDIAVKGIRLPQRSTRHITFLKKIILPTSLRLLI